MTKIDTAKVAAEQAGDDGAIVLTFNLSAGTFTVATWGRNIQRCELMGALGEQVLVAIERGDLAPCWGWADLAKNRKPKRDRQPHGTLTRTIRPGGRTRARRTAAL